MTRCGWRLGGLGPCANRVEVVAMKSARGAVASWRSRTVSSVYSGLGFSPGAVAEPAVQLVLGTLCGVPAATAVTMSVGYPSGIVRHSFHLYANRERDPTQRRRRRARPTRQQPRTRQWRNRAGPSEPFLRNASPSRSGPRIDKRGEMRSRSQPKFLRVWLRIIDAYSGRERHAQPVLPPETTPGNGTGTGGRRDAARAHTGILRRMRGVAVLVPSSPASRYPDPFPPLSTVSARD